MGFRDNKLIQPEEYTDEELEIMLKSGVKVGKQKSKSKDKEKARLAKNVKVGR